VVGIDAAAHKVIVGPQSALACHEVTLSETSWVVRNGMPAAGGKVLARLRNTAPALPATLKSVDGNRAVLRLDPPQFGIASGQAAVLYDVTNSDAVLGGGWIAAAPTIGFDC
jgi:tRNA-specific 2-thiouridylase